MRVHVHERACGVNASAGRLCVRWSFLPSLVVLYATFYAQSKHLLLRRAVGSFILSGEMNVFTPSTLDFLQLLATSTEKEACLLLKYKADVDLLVFRDIATDILSGKIPLAENLVPFQKQMRLLTAATTPTDVKKIFLGNDPLFHTTTALDFFIDMADSNEKEGDILMRCASEKHLLALRDTAMELLVGKLHLTQNQEYALEPFWAEIRELALSKNAKEISKNLFWHFGGRLPLLRAMIIPSLIHTGVSAVISKVL